MRLVSMLLAAMLAGPLTVEAQDVLRIPLDWEPHPSYPSDAVVPPFRGLPRIVVLWGGTEIRRRPSTTRLADGAGDPTRQPHHSEAGERPRLKPTNEQPGPGAMERYVFRVCNEYRRQHGLPDLELDLRLSAASRDHSNDMKTHRFYSHDSPLPGKTEFTDRAERFGTTAFAENIAMGCKDGEEAFQLWLDSSGHRENIMGSFRRVGIGQKDGYYTQMFGN